MSAPAQPTASPISVSRSTPLSSELFAKSALEEDMLESDEHIDPKKLLWGSRDLDGDGVPEVIIALIDKQFAAGGSNGFEHRIYTQLDDDVVRILAVNGNEFTPDCTERHEGFCDIIIDGDARMRFSSGSYVAMLR